MASSTSNLSDYKPGSIPDGKDYVIGIVCSEWNEEITTFLLKGCSETLIKHGVRAENLIIARVPGSFELPYGASMMIDSNYPDAVICLGCVVKGETRHDEYIATAVAKGIMDLSLENGLPVIFGLLTTENQQQALDRSGGKHGNKGVECAVTALKMIGLENKLYGEPE